MRRILVPSLDSSYSLTIYMLHSHSNNNPQAVAETRNLKNTHSLEWVVYLIGEDVQFCFLKCVCGCTGWNVGSSQLAARLAAQ